MRARCFLLLLFAVSAYATDPFISRLGDSAEELKKGNYAKALKMDERLIGDMVEQLGPGNVAAKWFSVAVTHKALALAGLGRNDDAIWYWHVAVNLYPAVERSDMSMFGAPAELLKMHPLKTPDVPRVGAPDDPGPKIRAPIVVKRVEPRYPYGARFFGVGGAAILESVIAKDGKVYDVRVLQGLPSPTLTYTAMEALRQWRFKPATLDGQPVEVIFNLTVNYRLR